MFFICSKGLSIPKIFAYSFVSNNKTQTKYLLMEYVEGADLGEFWFDLGKRKLRRSWTSQQSWSLYNVHPFPRG
jgi:hypothetical protein